MQLLHAGLYRYHDYAKLREAIRNKSSNSTNNQTSNNGISSSSHFSTSSLSSFSSFSLYNTSSLSSTLTSSTTISQSRPFLTSTFASQLQNLRLKSLERNANSNPTSIQTQYEFLSELIQNHPEAMIERFEFYPQFVIDERIMILYFSALQRVNKLHTFNLASFIKRLNKNSGSGSGVAVQMDPLKYATLMELHESIKNTGVAAANGGTTTTTTTTTTPAKRISAKGSNMATQVMHIISGTHPGIGLSSTAAAAASSRFGSIGSGLGAGLGQGGDPKNPLYVSMHSPKSGRLTILNFAKQITIAFIVVSALTALLDEKGLGGRAMGGGMNGNKHIQEAEGSDVRFSDVKGVDEAKADLEEIVEYLKHPDKFTRLGGKLPTGLLLTGPPGTGKTMLAKAIAGEAGVPFFFSSGSQFEEVYVGLGAKRIRELFEAAKKKGPAIIFIDEIDAVGGSRKLKDQSALKMTLNELLVQMDGFDDNNGIIVIGATNFAESLDSALLRPGRFDKHVTVPLPDVGGRKEILEVYAKKTRLAKDVDLSVVARGTIGFSGADLYNLMNQAALKASTDGLNSVTMQVLEYAKDKIMMGAERRTAVITPKTAKVTAFHEAGHALVAALTDGAQPIHKATIMPRGQALGMVMMLPEGDQTSQSFKEMIAFMDVAMGGRVAEELIFGDDNITSGASSDIASATRIARAMVTKYGFSDEIGIVFHGGNTGEESASGATRAKIDSEVKKLTEKSYDRARELLKKHSKSHHLLAQTLLEYETLTGDEVRDIVLRGKKPNRPIANKDGGARGDRSALGGNNNGASSTKSRIPGLSSKVAGSRRDEKRTT